MALTPEQLAQLQKLAAQGNFTNGISFGDPNTFFAPMGVQTQDEGGTGFTTQGYAQYDPNHLNPGDSYAYWDPTGQTSSTRTVENGGSVGDLLKTTISDNAEGAALLAALYGAGSLINGGFLGFGGAEGAIDPALAVQGNSINALDAATGVPYGSEAAAAAGAAGAGGAGAAGAAGGAGAAGAAGAAATGAGVVGDVLKTVLPVVGAVAGSQGTQNSSTTQRDIPDWLKPSVIGTADHPGLLGYTQQTLDRMMAPGFLAGYDQERNVGQHLMATPQVGNLYDKFFGANAQPIRYQPSGPARPISAFGGL
jgi:hypothetical protein